MIIDWRDLFPLSYNYFRDQMTTETIKNKNKLLVHKDFNKTR